SPAEMVKLSVRPLSDLTTCPKAIFDAVTESSCRFAFPTELLDNCEEIMIASVPGDTVTLGPPRICRLSVKPLSDLTTWPLAIFAAVTELLCRFTALTALLDNCEEMMIASVPGDTVTLGPPRICRLSVKPLSDLTTWP